MYKLSLSLLVSLVFATSCYNLKDVQCTGAKEFNISKINTEGINAQVSLMIKNPNNFGFKVLPSEFDIYYGGVKVGKAKTTAKVKIAKNQEQLVPFELKGDFKSITLGEVMKLLESISSQSFIEVKGDLKVGKFVLRKSFPVNVKQKLAANN
ncbi:MAG: LEA type 2 family protein [Bacteroidia bacterium]|nr:LEA type 2 family protein [Bacteroidia bacterium]